MPYTTDGQVPYQSGSETSYQSAVKQARNPQRGAKLAMLLICYREAGAHGLTDPEAAAFLGRALGLRQPVLIQSICSLRNRLVEDGVIQKAGTRLGTYGKQVQVWVWCGEEQ